MMEITSDPDWADASKVKTLILEHHMAAERMGFSDLFDPLDNVDRFKTSFRDGTLASMRLFSESLLPLIEAHLKSDAFELMSVLRLNSPLLWTSGISVQDSDGDTGLERAKAAVAKLLKFFENGADPYCAKILQVTAAPKLFDVSIAA